MYPQQPTPPTDPVTPQPQPLQQQYSIDYLNEIAPQQVSDSGPSAKLMTAVLVVGLIALAGFGFMILNSKPSVEKRILQLQTRLIGLETIAKKQHKSLRDNDLRSINGTYQLFLSDSIQDITNIDPTLKQKKNDKSPPALKEKAYIENLSTKLEDSRLNSTLDRTYARDMAYEIGVVKSMITSIHKDAKKKSMKELLIKTDEKLTIIAKRFTEFNGSKV